MEENNLNSNNQMNTSNNVNQQAQSNNSNNKILFVVMALIIVGLAGYIVYSKFVQKDGPGSQEDSKVIDKNTYKTSDGKQVLKIMDLNDESAKQRDAELIEKNPKYSKLKFQYYGDFNGKLLGLFKDEESNEIFTLYFGDVIGDDSAGTRYYFFIDNKKDNKLYDLTYESNNKAIEYWFVKIGNTYYITKGGQYQPTTELFDLNVNKIADKYIEQDDQNNFYGYTDGYIVKYNESGKAIKKGTVKINSIYSEEQIVNNNLYLIVNINNTAYLYDFMNDSKYELGSLNTYKYCEKDTEGCTSPITIASSNEIKVILYAKDSNKNKDLIFIYNTNNKKITKQDEIKIEGVTFKTADGKKVLTINKKIEDEDENVFYDLISYDAYYNGKKYVIGSEILSSKYEVLGGVVSGKEGGQCGFTHEFIINTSNNTLVNMNYDMEYGYYYRVHKVGEKYYFSEGDCALTYMSHSVYDENLKKLGSTYLINDDKNNIYVLKDGLITKYNENSEIIKIAPSQYSYGYSILPFEDTLYIAIEENEKLYLADALTGEKYELGSSKDYSLADDPEFGPTVELIADNGNILIKMYGAEDLVKDTTYKFDLKTKTLLK